MKNTIKRTLILSVIAIMLFAAIAVAQEKAEKAPTFKEIKTLPHTAPKSQGASGTCWSFCTISLLESEVLRMGKEKVELSEMFPVYYSYIQRAVVFLRTQGKNNFQQGGIDNDVLWVARTKGLVRDQDYSGLWKGEKFINHSQMEKGLRAILDSLLKSKRLSKKWKSAFVAALNSYMTAPPTKIKVDGKEMTPLEFTRDHLGIIAEDYVGITSFTHMPLYKQSELYLPDNWYHHSDFYNVKLDEFIEIIKTAINKGYTVSIGADVSEKSWGRNGVATWNEGKTVTVEEREAMWDDWSTGDDHGMHTVGLAEDENGTTYFYTKNSWGTYGPYKGYHYISENYIRAKINAITIHKDALTDEMKAKLGIK